MKSLYQDPEPLFTALSLHLERFPNPWFQDLDFNRSEHFLPNRFWSLFSGAGRRLGHPPLTTGYTCSEIARLKLILSAEKVLPLENFPEFIDRLYRQGDLLEQVAVLKTLPYLKNQELFLDTACEALRTNCVSVFEAIALDNPYPMNCFSNHFFYHTVLKALFLDLDIQRIQGLKKRFDSQLQRMVMDYKRERQIANRSMPHGISYIENTILESV